MIEYSKINCGSLPIWSSSTSSALASKASGFYIPGSNPTRNVEIYLYLYNNSHVYINTVRIMSRWCSGNAFDWTAGLVLINMSRIRIPIEL